MRIALLLVCAFVGGCTAPQASSLSPEARDPVVCEGADQCALYWKRAQLWIATNSRWKIQNATDVVITTYTPTNSSAHYGCQVIREPMDNKGRERIGIQPICANMFGCGDLNGTLVSFKRYVRGI